jgi:hypothetical protein
MCLAVATTKQGQDDVQPGGGEGDMSDRSCYHKTRAETTYSLKANRQCDVSDCSCDRKTRVETTYSLKVTCQTIVETTKRGQERRTAWR